MARLPNPNKKPGLKPPGMNTNIPVYAGNGVPGVFSTKELTFTNDNVYASENKLPETIPSKMSIYDQWRAGFMSLSEYQKYLKNGYPATLVIAVKQK